MVAALAAVAGAVVVVGVSGADEGATPLELVAPRLKPKRAYFDAAKQVTIRYSIGGEEARDLRISIQKRGRGKGSGRIVRKLRANGVEPGRRKTVRWDGLTNRHGVAGDGKYRVLIGEPGLRAHPIGSFRWHGHFYPIRGHHSERFGLGEFHAPRSGGRIHEGFDTWAGCGTKLVAARGGRVIRRGYDPVLYGNFVLISGRKDRQDYFYAHMRGRAVVKPGKRVLTGGKIGQVGETGNARTIGCQLHIEIHLKRMPIDPAPQMRRWDRYS